MIQTYVVQCYSRSSYVNKDDSLLALLLGVLFVFFLALTTHLADLGQARKVKMVTLKSYTLELLPSKQLQEFHQRMVAPSPTITRPSVVQAQPQVRSRSTFRHPTQAVVRTPAPVTSPQKIATVQRQVTQTPLASYVQRPARIISASPGPVETVRREFPKRPVIDFGEAERKIPDFARGRAEAPPREIPQVPMPVRGGGGGSGSPIGRPDIALPGGGIGRGPEGRGGYGTVGALGEGASGTGGSGGGSGGGEPRGHGQRVYGSERWLGKDIAGVSPTLRFSEFDIPVSLAPLMSSLIRIERYIRKWAGMSTEGSVKFNHDALHAECLLPDGGRVVIKFRSRLIGWEYIEVSGKGVDKQDAQSVGAYKVADLIDQGIRQIENASDVLERR